MRMHTQKLSGFDEVERAHYEALGRNAPRA
jgi:hypothetical protein